jgi:hypothetical protein
VSREHAAGDGGMLVRRRRGGSVTFAPIDARLARAQLAAISALKVSR